MWVQPLPFYHFKNTFNHFWPLFTTYFPLISCFFLPLFPLFQHSYYHSSPVFRHLSAAKMLIFTVNRYFRSHCNDNHHQPGSSLKHRQSGDSSLLTPRKHTYCTVLLEVPCHWTWSQQRGATSNKSTIIILLPFLDKPLSLGRSRRRLQYTPYSFGESIHR
jgi:hypothetical protein